MTITASGAAGAYAATQGLAKPATNVTNNPLGTTLDKPQAAPPGTFGEMVQQAVTGTLETGQAAEQKALEMAEGKASIVDVVTAVAETEVAVETLVTVRDKVISAYKDIMNMPI
jgi:flagellar hook-basal body complex protein FliE